jgi:polysaccharide biosynthesis transport protein
MAAAVYVLVGERYEAYTLLRVGQGIKERAISTNSAFGDGVDLAVRIDSLARIGLTDHVIRQAVIKVGRNRVTPKNEKTLPSWLVQMVRQALSMSPQEDAKSDAPETPAQSELDEAEEAKKLDQATIAGLRNRISAKQEGRSDLLRISFRHSDPTVAAEFLNELAYALVAVQAELVQTPGADVFFQQQSERLEREADKAASDLKNFSIQASIYSVADQRSLLLKRANDLATQLAATRASIEDRKGQKQAIVSQLMVLRPVAQSKTVTGIVTTLAGRDFNKDVNSVGTTGLDESPPLLLIRVYQDAMANLLKLNSDMSGQMNLEKQLATQIEEVNAELAALSSKEAEYDRLKSLLMRASAAAQNYGNRMIEEQIAMDIAKKTQLSSVRIVQNAETPGVPIFPNAVHLVVLALIGGIGAGGILILLLEVGALRRQQSAEDDLDEDLSIAMLPLRKKREIQAAE